MVLFNKLFSLLDLSEKRIATSIQKVRDDVATTAYDRHSPFFRKINNLRRNIRLTKIRGKLPREVVDFIDSILFADISRNEAVNSIDSLFKYCDYHEKLTERLNAENKLNEDLNECGLSLEESEALESKIEVDLPDDFISVKENVLRVQEINNTLWEIAKEESINNVTMDLKKCEAKRIKYLALYLQNIVNRNIIWRWQQGVRIRQIIQKFARAFGKSKKAFKTFDNLRKEPDNFNSIMNLIPIWIMELDDASRIIPLEAGIFDYVILDEASQCNVAYTLPVMYRTNRVLFVGDSEQMRDSTIIFKSNRIFDELARRYQIPEDKQIKATGSAVQSVLDIAKNRGFLYKTLHYHYRSPAELINFSNKYFYKPNGKDLIPLNSNYLTYKDTNRVILVHEVKSDWNEAISDQINIAEGKAILNLFKNLRSDERYHDKSIGILSFFNAQATFIREIFEQDGHKEEKENYKVSIIEGIQGDEKDIIIYSLVIRRPEQKSKYVPLTGEGGDIRSDINKGRVNVAFSRARLQVHCFISIPLQEMPDKIWLKKYLEYAQEHGEVAFHSAEIKPFDSHFEEEFYNLLRTELPKGYKIQNQVVSCGFKIDFVISNGKSGRRLAVECDGPTHFKDEIDEMYGIHIQSDEERQRTLEAAGWQFWRIKYSDWVDSSFDRKDAVRDLIELLK